MPTASCRSDKPVMSGAVAAQNTSRTESAPGREHNSGALPLAGPDDEGSVFGAGVSAAFGAGVTVCAGAACDVCAFAVEPSGPQPNVRTKHGSATAKPGCPDEANLIALSLAE